MPAFSEVDVANPDESHPLSATGLPAAGENLALAGRCALMGLFLLISLVPFNFLQFIKIKAGGSEIPFYYPILAGLALTAFVLALGVRLPSSRQTALMTFLLALGPFLSAAAKHRLGISHSLAMFTLLGPMTVFSTTRVFRKTSHILFSIEVLAAVGVLIAGLGIMEALIHRNILYHTVFTLENYYYKEVLTNRGGISSTIGHALPLGAYLVLLLPLPLALRDKMSPAASYLCFSVILIAILMTLTRSSLIASVLVFMALLGGVGKGSRVSVLMITGLSLILFLLVSRSLARVVNQQGESQNEPLLILFEQRLNPLDLQREIFDSHRGASYKLAFRSIHLHPLMGVGFGNYPAIYKEVHVPGVESDIPTPDNQFLRWVVENGLIGLGLFAAFWTWFIARWLAVRNRAAGSAANALLPFLLLGMGGFLVNLMALDGFFWLATNYAFWLMTGLALALIQIGETEPA